MVALAEDVQIVIEKLRSKGEQQKLRDYVQL